MDYLKWRLFVNGSENNQQICCKILLDEARFGISEYFNKENYRIWGDENFLHTQRVVYGKVGQFSL